MRWMARAMTRTTDSDSWQTDFRWCGMEYAFQREVCDGPFPQVGEKDDEARADEP